MYDRPFNDNSYEQFLKEEKIMGAKCRKCGALALPPRPICVILFGQRNGMDSVQRCGETGCLHQHRRGPAVHGQRRLRQK